MQHDVVRVHARDERGRELATRAQAKASSVLRDPLGDRGGRERLAGIDQANPGSVAP